jgi:PIN domain nuclease of toxin-antitoxin system
MRLLADTNIFVRFCRRLPLPPKVESALSDTQTERCLSPISVVELFRLWQRGDVPDNPDSWLDLALPSWIVLPVTVAIARQSVLWL